VYKIPSICISQVVVGILSTGSNIDVELNTDCILKGKFVPEAALASLAYNVNIVRCCMATARIS
jgi:hypothetical protein